MHYSLTLPFTFHKITQAPLPRISLPTLPVAACRRPLSVVADGEHEPETYSSRSLLTCPLELCSKARRVFRGPAGPHMLLCHSLVPTALRSSPAGYGRWVARKPLAADEGAWSAQRTYVLDSAQHPLTSHWLAPVPLGVRAPRRDLLMIHESISARCDLQVRTRRVLLDASA
ncbi:hypothetical protein L226DRAFT_536331 [Lentinus tigrinus ALCF2SS1-7]|uniref:uncharacterized protein n=1 Tax=Lentinus tigrinus ALCF2SS1-7 TaxID=1328758 RepID=UPI0011660958|nr:hypothetical protein L226DRAFT_536331 [Lentinus tigrinus ALCF2SS1-7]